MIFFFLFLVLYIELSEVIGLHLAVTRRLMGSRQDIALHMLT